MLNPDRGVVKFARVLFSCNKTVEILPIERIKIIKGNKYYTFLPQNKEDFIRLKYVYVAKLLDENAQDKNEGTKGLQKQKHGIKIVSILNLGGM